MDRPTNIPIDKMKGFVNRNRLGMMKYNGVDLVDEDSQELPVEPHILDSGYRTSFASGAVRDMREGKGRCDLLPLDVIGTYMNNPIFIEIGNYQATDDVNCLYRCLNHFLSSSMGTFDGNTYTMLLEVAKHFEEGAKKYGDNNWRKGIPVNVYLDSAIRHYLKYLRCDNDEPHDRAFCWNILCAIWTAKHMPELNPYIDGSKEKAKDG